MNIPPPSPLPREWPLRRTRPPRLGSDAHTFYEEILESNVLRAQWPRHTSNPGQRLEGCCIVNV